MIRTFSKRLLSPYVGTVQVAEMESARALSMDGDNWAIQYFFSSDKRTQVNHSLNDPSLNASLVATIKQGEVKTHPIHPILDPDDVLAAIGHLSEAIATQPVPFAAADRYECWLLDAEEGRPLALLQSCLSEEEIPLVNPPPQWMAMPASMLEIESPRSDDDSYVPPVNYRLQKQIEKRAGSKPRGMWINRNDMYDEELPPCLIREDWPDEAAQKLCDLYISRLSPRLLMIPGLPHGVRQRLENAARAHAFDVERFHPLYPEILDENLVTAARVEAELRRSTQD